MKKLFAIILCIAILMGLTACSGSFEELMASAIKYADSNTAQYNKILEDAGIVHASPVFGENIASYVSKEENNGIFCADYVYKNDVVSAWAETSYIYVKDYTEEQLINLRMNLQAKLGYLELVECCKMSMTQVGDYYKVSCVFTDVDKEENYEALYRAELTTENTSVSMKASEELQLEQGAVKK